MNSLPKALVPAGESAEDAIVRLADRAADEMAAGNWPAARQTLEGAVQLAPDVAALHAACGGACYRLGDLSAAATGFARALELSPADPELMVQFGEIQLALGHRKVAEAMALRARLLVPAHDGAAGLLVRCQPPEEASPESERVSRTDAKAMLRKVSLDEGLTLEIGEYSYVHGGRIRNPSGAKTHVRIGRFCSIATDLTVIGFDHRSEWITMYPFLDAWHRLVWDGTATIPPPAHPDVGGNIDRGNITIGSDVWIGHDVKIFKGVTIGHGAVIGACSLVNKDVPPYTVVAGIPARPIRQRFGTDDQAILLALAWWDWPEETINHFLPLLCSGRIRELQAAVDADRRRRVPATPLPALRDSDGEAARAAIQGFIDKARAFFAEVEPPRLGDENLRNSRVLPNRKDILRYLPKGGVCAEIGTQTGRFAKSILEVLQPKKFHIYDLDFTPFDIAHFRAAIAEGVVELHAGDSSSLLGELPDQSLDFVYVDGDHGYDGVARDLAQAARKIKPDGWIVCNDYTPYSPLEQMKYGVYRAVNELCLSAGFEIVYLGLHNWGYHDVALRRIGVGKPADPAS